LGLACLSGRLRLRSRDNSKAPDEGFRLRVVGRTQRLAYVVNTMAKSCAPVRLSKNSVIL